MDSNTSRFLPASVGAQCERAHIGRHGGGSAWAKLGALATRTAWMVRFGRGRGFDLAVAHGSNDLALAAAALRIPAANMFDYEYARLQHMREEHLRQGAAEQMEKRERELVDADIVVFPVGARRLQRPRTAFGSRRGARILRLGGRAYAGFPRGTRRTSSTTPATSPAARQLRPEADGLLLSGFGRVAIGTMAAAAVAAVSALQMIGSGEDHVGAVPIEVFAFDGIGRGGHGC